ncbi:hypothetical protein BDR26DRAFT_860195 [Obelidium mucronatum]|nr:hypothetical protein BDR26DRAFT_860195 [Obelidium mucronatum]
MALYMQKNPQLFTGKRVVELGAGGSGLLAVLGVRIGVKAWIATDWGSDTVLERLSENIARNGVDSTAKAAPYRWGDHALTNILASNSAIEAHDGFSTTIPHLLNLLVAADVIYPSMSSIQICDLLTSFKVLHKSPETNINEFYCSYIHRDYSGETLKRVLNAVLEVEGLMVDVVDFEDDEAKRQGGSIFRFWFGSELDTRQKMVQVVGERVMPSIWEKKEQIAEEWSFPFQYERI